MMTNARSRYTIYFYNGQMNNLHIQNANRFIHSCTVIGERKLNETITDLQAKGAEIKTIYNGCGEVMKIGA